MSLAESHIPGQLRHAAAMESSLLSQIHSVADDLQRVDCFDEEQRAEIHAILEAMKHDSESHSAIVQYLAMRCGQEPFHA